MAEFPMNDGVVQDKLTEVLVAVAARAVGIAGGEVNVWTVHVTLDPSMNDEMLPPVACGAP
jgi:hypothetical protein